MRALLRSKASRFRVCAIAVLVVSLLSVLAFRATNRTQPAASTSQPTVEAERKELTVVGTSDVKLKASRSKNSVDRTVAKPSYHVVSWRELVTELEISAQKILSSQLGLDLPASSRNFGHPRQYEFQMDPSDAAQLAVEIEEVLRDRGNYEGRGTAYDLDRWEEITISEGEGMPPGTMQPNIMDGSYKIYKFAPKLSKEERERTAELDGDPCYVISINPTNGFTALRLGTTGDG